MVKKPINDIINLPHNASILIYNANKNFSKKEYLDKKDGIIIYTLEINSIFTLRRD